MSQECDPNTAIERVDLQSLDVAEQKRQELLRLFPEVRTEGGKIDFDRLELTLGATVDAGKERYGLTWPGKAECFRTIQTPSTATLRPMRDESVNFDTTENLIIEGDNPEVLKLLQKAYLGKGKMIYIDPPYNTGNDFIYQLIHRTASVCCVGRRKRLVVYQVFGNSPADYYAEDLGRFAATIAAPERISFIVLGCACRSIDTYARLERRWDAGETRFG